MAQNTRSYTQFQSPSVDDTRSVISEGGTKYLDEESRDKFKKAEEKITEFFDGNNDENPPKIQSKIQQQKSQGEDVQAKIGDFIFNPEKSVKSVIDFFNNFTKSTEENSTKVQSNLSKSASIYRFSGESSNSFYDTFQYSFSWTQDSRSNLSDSSAHVNHNKGSFAFKPHDSHDKDKHSFGLFDDKHSMPPSIYIQEFRENSQIQSQSNSNSSSAINYDIETQFKEVTTKTNPNLVQQNYSQKILSFFADTRKYFSGFFTKKDPDTTSNSIKSETVTSKSPSISSSKTKPSAVSKILPSKSELTSIPKIWKSQSYSANNSQNPSTEINKPHGIAFFGEGAKSHSLHPANIGGRS